MSSTRYEDAAQHLLHQADTEFASGDYRQASEKAWGAAAQAVKAASEARGWPHDSHRLLFIAINQLFDETSDRSLIELFAVAHHLHVNFYENWLPEWMVRQGIVAAKRLVERLANIPLPQEPQ